MEKKEKMKKKFMDSLQPNLRKDYELNEWVRQTEKSKPYVDTVMGTMWGSDVKESANGKVSKA